MAPQDNIISHSANLITEELVNKGKMEEKLMKNLAIMIRLLEFYVMYEDLFITAKQ